MSRHHLRSGAGPGRVLEVDPSTAGWSTLDFSVLALEAGTTTIVETLKPETRGIPLSSADKVVTTRPGCLSRSR